MFVPTRVCMAFRLVGARPQVYVTSFDSSQDRGSQPSSSTSKSRMSQGSTSWESPEAYEANQEEPIVDVDTPVDSYPWGLFYTFLLHIHGDHAARNVWKREVYLFTFALHFLLHMFYSNVITTDDDIFLQECQCLKFVKHKKNILDL